MSDPVRHWEGYAKKYGRIEYIVIYIDDHGPYVYADETLDDDSTDLEHFKSHYQEFWPFFEGINIVPPLKAEDVWPNEVTG